VHCIGHVDLFEFEFDHLSPHEHLQPPYAH